jgi:hypothetical protein
MKSENKGGVALPFHVSVMSAGNARNAGGRHEKAPENWGVTDGYVHSRIVISGRELNPHNPKIARF